MLFSQAQRLARTQKLRPKSEKEEERTKINVLYFSTSSIFSIFLLIKNGNVPIQLGEEPLQEPSLHMIWESPSSL